MTSLFALFAGFLAAAADGDSFPEPVWSLDETRAFDGVQGIEIRDGLHAEKGFAVDIEVCFDDMDREHQILRQDGLCLLRVDPPGEGANISFFVDIDGKLEPRLRSMPVETGKWYRVTASWNGDTMWLRVNDGVFRAERPGGPASIGRPLTIGGGHASGAAGLRGALRNARVYDSPMTETETLLRDAESGEVERGVLPATPCFEFDNGEDGWRIGCGNESKSKSEAGCLVAEVGAPGTVLVADGLDYDLEGLSVVSLRLAVNGGTWGKCYAATSAGKREVLFSLKPDGKMHGYALWMDQYPEWRGQLTTLALVLDERAGEVHVDFVRCSAEVQAPPEFEIDALYVEPAYLRAGRNFVLQGRWRNAGGRGSGLGAVVRLPDGLVVQDTSSRLLPEIGHGEYVALSWTLRAERALSEDVRIVISGQGIEEQTTTARMDVTAARDVAPCEYVPEPLPVATKRLVGAHYCPLWKEGARNNGGWSQIEPFPEREPLLGWYDENDPEVTDWEIKWAVDHGIGFFVYCWYRAHQGAPVETFLGHAIHEGLFHARYRDRFRFCIMWENQSRGHWGADSEADLLENLLPFWIETYFKHPSYLVLDNKPLLFIYRPENVIDDVGGMEQARAAFDKMRQRCREAGFDGLHILGEDRGTARPPLERMANLGLDCSFSYCWPISDNPEGPAAVAAQERYWRARKDMAILPDLVTVSMGWDSTPWHPSFSQWRLTPAEFETVCRRADAFLGELPEDGLESRIVLLDNWNEFGEGHYIAPHRQYGFGYLDAVRAAFSDAPAAHEDLVPQDVGLGPYDTLYAAKKAREAETRQIVFREGGDRPGLVAWWTFDEADGDPFAWDYTGHGHGGRLRDARRVPGRSGKALECAGGAIEVPSSPDFAPRRGITVACWLKTDVPNQTDRWFVNRIHDGKLDTGYRFGLNNGCLVWAVPQTTWSHHLTAPVLLPIGRWVHVAATCDNAALRICIDGEPVAELPRWGVVKDGGTRLVLGNYDSGHRAFFEGLLDEVRLFDRALDTGELRALAERDR